MTNPPALRAAAAAAAARFGSNFYDDGQRGGLFVPSFSLCLRASSCRGSPERTGQPGRTFLAGFVETAAAAVRSTMII